MICFDVVSLFTNVPVNEAQHVTRNMLTGDQTLTQSSSLQVNIIIELLEICLKTTCFQDEDKFFQQKDGIAVG
jgi:hypothetical protein